MNTKISLCLCALCVQNLSVPLRALCSKSLCALCALCVQNLSALSARSVFKIFCTPAKSKTQQYRDLQPVGLFKIPKKLGTARGAREGLAGTLRGMPILGASDAETQPTDTPADSPRAPRSAHPPSTRSDPASTPRPCAGRAWQHGKCVRAPRSAPPRPSATAR